MDSEAEAIARKDEEHLPGEWARELSPLPPLEVHLRCAQYTDPQLLSPESPVRGRLRWEEQHRYHTRAGVDDAWYVYAVREASDGP